MVTMDFTPQLERLLALRAGVQGDTPHAEDNTPNHDSSQNGKPIEMPGLEASNFDQEFTLSLPASGNNDINQIEAAIERIQNGSYGRCECCGVRIPKARLDATPYAAQCVPCASEQDECHGR